MRQHHSFTVTLCATLTVVVAQIPGSWVATWVASYSKLSWHRLGGAGGNLEGG